MFIYTYKNKKILFFFLLLFIFIGCDNLFEYSIYTADVKNSRKNTISKNKQTLELDTKNIGANFKFAIISDTHYFYDELKLIVDHINQNKDILFVVVNGDITEQGLLKEFDLFYDIIKNLNKPYFTTIGNHEYLSNGEDIYKQMFGSFNYNLTINNKTFIFFDNTVWESDKEPDFNWLSNQLTQNSENQKYVIAHIPPEDEQLTDNMREEYYRLMETNNVQLSIHGHAHSFSFSTINNVNYLIVPTIRKKAYNIIEVSENSFETNHIEL